jgi:acetyl esterase
LLDIYRPHDALRPLPTIMYVHGGAFSMMSKETHAIMGYMLASRGYQVFNINYRLGPIHQFPKPLEDVSAALHWIWEHGAEYGADLDRLALVGDSAGANLVLALAYCCYHPRPESFARSLFDRQIRLRCVAPLYGVLDLQDMERLWRDPRKSQRIASWIKRELQGTALSYLGSQSANNPDNALASPLRLFEQEPAHEARELPPFFTTVGTADPLISDSVRLREALRRRNIDCELHVYRGEIHAFNVMLWRKAAREKWHALSRFLRRHMINEEASLPTESLDPSAYVSFDDLVMSQPT